MCETGTSHVTPCDITDTALSTRRPALPGLTARVTSSKMQGFQSPFPPPASRNPSHSVLLTAVRTISFCCPVRINICTGRLLRPVGQVVKTTASHAVNGSSTLPRVTINKHQLRNNNLSFFPIFVPLDGKEPHADVVELADAADSKSVGSNTMRVQVPPSAPMRCITENGRASGTTI